MVCVTWMIEEHGGGNGVFGDKSPDTYLFLFFTDAIGIYIGIGIIIRNHGLPTTTIAIKILPCLLLPPLYSYLYSFPPEPAAHTNSNTTTATSSSCRI